MTALVHIVRRGGLIATISITSAGKGVGSEARRTRWKAGGVGAIEEGAREAGEALRRRGACTRRAALLRRGASYGGYIALVALVGGRVIIPSNWTRGKAGGIG